MSTQQTFRNRISNGWAKVMNFAIAMDYNEQDYAADRIASLQNEVVTLKARLEQLETPQSGREDLHVHA